MIAIPEELVRVGTTYAAGYDGDGGSAQLGQVRADVKRLSGSTVHASNPT